MAQEGVGMRAFGLVATVLWRAGAVPELEVRRTLHFLAAWFVIDAMMRAGTCGWG